MLGSSPWGHRRACPEAKPLGQAPSSSAGVPKPTTHSEHSDHTTSTIIGVTGVNQVQAEWFSNCCSCLSSPHPPHLLPAAIRYAEGPPTPSAHGQEGSAPQQSVTACFLSPLSSCIVLDFSTALSPGILFIVGFILKRFQMTLPPPLG